MNNKLSTYYLIVNKSNKVVAVTQNKGTAEFYRKNYDLLEKSKHTIVVKSISKGETKC